MKMQQATPQSLRTADHVYSVVITTSKRGVQSYEVLDVRDGKKSGRELAADLIAAAYDLLKRLN
jgi:hypothetical protein